MSVRRSRLQPTKQTDDAGRLLIFQTRASLLAQMRPSTNTFPISIFDEAGQLAWWRGRDAERWRSELLWSRPLGRPCSGCGYVHIEMGGQGLQFHPQRMASFGMKAYRSRLARVLAGPCPTICAPGPALPFFPGPAQMIPDVAIHEPGPKYGEAAEECRAAHGDCKPQGEARGPIHEFVRTGVDMGSCVSPAGHSVKKSPCTRGDGMLHAGRMKTGCLICGN